MGHTIVVHMVSVVAMKQGWAVGKQMDVTVCNKAFELPRWRGGKDST